jgi:hypothetical protein
VAVLALVLLNHRIDVLQAFQNHSVYQAHMLLIVIMYMVEMVDRTTAVNEPINEDVLNRRSS